MTDENIKKASGNSFASPPCLAHEIDPTYFDPLDVDPEQECDVARWRKATRQELRTARKTLSVAEHTSLSVGTPVPQNSTHDVWCTSAAG